MTFRAAGAGQGSLLEIFGALEHKDQISKPVDFVRYYDAEFAPFRNKRLTVVEVGIYRGHFLRALESFLPAARILGIDIAPNVQFEFSDRVKIFGCSQSDAAELSRIFEQHAPDGVDILIDDASHIGTYSHDLFHGVFERWMRPGGRYYIEDWGTGYWDEWPDGAAYQEPRFEDVREGKAARILSHQAGMVGFIKSLVDEVGVEDRRVAGTTGVANLFIRPGIVRVDKRS